MNGKVLLFYKYVTITYPDRIAKWQRKICQELGLTGRIFIAQEGINATVGGSVTATERYKKIMLTCSLFDDIVFKESPGNAQCFEKLQVTVKKEIVGLKAPEKKAAVQNTGTHLSPEQVHTLITNKPDNLVILDARNKYEYEIGRFVDAIPAEINTFREFPEYIDKNLEQFKDKDVLMYCTGGIRCERATAYLQEKNIANTIYQIDGGIHMYAEKYPDGFFRGKNYVFDNRIALKVTDDILGRCSLCNTSCDEYINCVSAQCNKHFIACDSCKQFYQETCSTACKQAIVSGAAPKRPNFNKVSIDTRQT